MMVIAVVMRCKIRQSLLLSWCLVPILYAVLLDCFFAKALWCLVHFTIQWYFFLVLKWIIITTIEKANELRPKSVFSLRSLHLNNIFYFCVQIMHVTILVTLTLSFTASNSFILPIISNDLLYLILHLTFDGGTTLALFSVHFNFFFVRWVAPIVVCVQVHLNCFLGVRAGVIWFLGHWWWRWCIPSSMGAGHSTIIKLIF